MANSPTREAGDALKSARDEIAGGAKDVADKASATAERVGTQAKAAARQLSDTVTSGANDVADSMNRTLRAVGVDSDHLVESAREQASDLQRMIEEEVRDRPLRALGIAAAIGLFVGYLSAR